MTTRSVSIVLAWCTLLRLSWAPLQAQTFTLTGTLRDEGGSPVGGAAIYVLDQRGGEVGAVLSDRAGRFQADVPATGTYSLRVERIGFETETVPSVRVVGEGTTFLEVSLRVRPLELDILHVRAGRVCRAERNRNPELIRIWSEVRKALAQTALASADSSGGYRVEMSERTLDPSLHVRRWTADTTLLQGAHAFTFLAVQELGPGGWGEQADEDVTTLFGPSPEAFLSARFGATHCLSLRAAGDTVGSVGLDFESIADSLEIGMRGTFWVDPGSWRLERIDFVYTGTEQLEDAPHQGGTVLVDVADDGLWYAAAWSIRGPLYERGDMRTEVLGARVIRTQIYRLTGYIEHAGRVIAPREVGATAVSPWATPEVLAALRPDPARNAAAVVGEAILAACGTAPEAAAPAVVAGTVTDSLSGVPLPQARVRMTWRERGDTATRAQEARTDERGYFQFCEAPAGQEVVLTATLRVPSAPASLELEPAMLHVQHLRIGLSDPTQPGLLVGRVIDAESRKPIGGADVRLGEGGARTVTNGAGYFSFGSQPWGIYTVVVSALGYADASSAVRIQGGLAENAEIRLSTEPIPIEGIEVTVQGRLSRHTMDDLVRRMRLGFGTFVTRDVIERRPGARVADLLREAPGVSVRFNGRDPILVVRDRFCTPDVYLDGVYWNVDLDYVLTGLVSSDLEAIEIYKGFSEVPGEFMRLGYPPCAVILLWTR